MAGINGGRPGPRTLTPFRGAPLATGVLVQSDAFHKLATAAGLEPACCAPKAHVLPIERRGDRLVPAKGLEPPRPARPTGSEPVASAIPPCRHEVGEGGRTR